MRPVHRGDSPHPEDFSDYRNAFEPLVRCLGVYCSYCERRIPTNLAVEHIQPKGLPQYRHLIGRWENFLLGCVNCNGTKTDKDVLLDQVYLPDRDNTFAAFEYTEEGLVRPAEGLTEDQQAIARATLRLTGLDRGPTGGANDNDQLIAVDRIRFRREVWQVAELSRNDLEARPIEEMRRQIVRTALGYGAFSVWMKVFESDPEMRQRFIAEFTGTAHDCFDPMTTRVVSPRLDNRLTHSGKI